MAAVRVRILEMAVCDTQPFPNRSFCARPPILGRGHHSRTRSPHFRAHRPGAAAVASQWASWHNPRTFRSVVHGQCKMSKAAARSPGTNEPGATTANTQSNPIACNRASQQQCNSTAKQRYNRVSQQASYNATAQPSNDTTLHACNNATAQQSNSA